MVVDEVHDLDLGPIGEHPVGDVGLPALVRQLSLEPDPGASGALVRLGGDEPSTTEHPPDRGDRRGAAPVSQEVVVDGLGAGIKALIRKFLAEPYDLVFDLPGSSVGDAFGRFGPRLDPGVASGPEPPHHLRDPALRHPVGPRHLPVAPPL